MTLRFDWRSGFTAFDQGGAYLTNGFMGVRFTARDGVHHAWLRWDAGSLQFGPVTSAFNPWPGESITVGQPGPSPLRIRRTGNGLAAAYWPMGTTGIFERRLPSQAGAWNDGWLEVTPTGANEHTEVGLDTALFRFRPTP